MRNTFFIPLACAFFLSSCRENDPSPSHLVDFVGTWKVETVILDEKIEDDWDFTQFEITLMDKEGLLVSCVDQPDSRILIWPDKSSLQLMSNEPLTIFQRDDGIEVLLMLSHEELLVQMHPPRSFSYDVECLDDDYYLVCSEEGQWRFSLIKQ
ncbi:MAG: hypothetical protein CMB80_22780 [Flammeovirgaceae bacterium]|nr:hypothetical protein [Flammeovirgaceae bacterium]MBE62099.1 hypothetical protein [Flammeovirgaceae bacterium]HCX24622.1 hypothetical protein [Cytophagales bacterium]